MPDNKNPPENDAPPKPEGEEEKISRVDEIIECKHPDCRKPALSLSPFCWEHIKSRGEYRNKIQEWTRSGKSMEKFILTDADLSNKELKGVKLSGAWIFRTNLSRSNLQGSNLSGARLWRADFSGAMLLFADLKEARLNWTNLTGAKGLKKESFNEKLTIEEKKDSLAFKESYLTVKNYFIQSGRYDDASWAAFKERTLERITLCNAVKKKGITGLRYRSWWKTLGKWFASKIFNMLCGYGEKPLYAVRASAVIVIFFSIIFYVFKWIQSYPMEKLHFLDYLYFSIVTFTTLGYGDIRPMAASLARIFAGMEAFIGAFMIALFVWTLARRYVAR